MNKDFEALELQSKAKSYYEVLLDEEGELWLPNLTEALIAMGISYTRLSDFQNLLLVTELNPDQTARLNIALAELQASQNNIDRLVLQIFSELKVDYREVELKPNGQGKWQIVKKVDSKIGSTLATPTPTATASPTPQSK